MKRISSLFLAFALILGLCACAKAAPWQEQYDLGVRYLSEGNYEEAIIAFTAAIEIDPKRPEAYLDMAYAYIGQNDFDAAREILARGYELTQDDSLKAKLDELDSGNITDYAGNVRKMSVYDDTGALLYYHTYTYDSQNRKASATSFDAAGNQTGYVDLAYDDAWNPLVNFFYLADTTGEINSKTEYEYDSNGNVVREKAYNLATGELSECWLYQYDEQGNRIREERYSGEEKLLGYKQYIYGEHSLRLEDHTADGTLSFYQVWNYREDGRDEDYAFYNADGTLDERTVYHYDDEGRDVGGDKYGADGALKERWVYRYDDDGNYIGSDTYDGAGNLTKSTVYN